MKVECPYKDWEGDNSLLAIHLSEIHQIQTESNPGSYNNPIQLPKKQKKKDFFQDNLGANLGSMTFWLAGFAFFILGVIVANTI